jgi:serine/threonine-protein kinase
MERTRWERVQSLFHRATELPEAEREAFLRSACVGDEGLLAEILAMLRADGDGSFLLDHGLPGIADQVLGGPMDLVREIGPYKLIRILGEGGMGVVWLAQREDTGTLVAIKFLPNASLSPIRRERFAREIKTLAKLKHPFIARLYDAGTLADGTPWFVMEYVEGERLTEYCHRQQPSADELLRLFRKVCEAVQYAHSQEIIHRDLKPTNIMVEKDGTPRLLDFGIARELQGLEEPSEQTRPGLRFLSPDYAAPEWVREGTVGFFTDVYSLGVVLYEMLTGRLPFPRPRGAAEQAHLSTEALVGKPSAAALPRLLGNNAPRGAWPDLDVLCLKALRIDPRERYQSVEALLRDLDHYLRNEPLEARPDSRRYRLGKFVKRNRRPVLAAGLTFALVAGLVIFFTIHLARARNAAQFEATREQRIRKFMTDLFQGDDAEAGPSQDLRVITLLDRGVDQAQALNSEPEVQAELYRTLGGIYERLGKYDRSSALFESALKEDRSLPPDKELAVADDLVGLGLLRSDQHRPQEAETLVRQALALVESHRPLDLTRQANETSALGDVLTEKGDYSQAEKVLHRATELQSKRDPGSVEFSDTLGSLSTDEIYLGHYDEAEAVERQGLELDKKIHGAKHPAIASDLINLGQLEETRERYAEAERYERQAVEITKAWYGPENLDSARQSAILAETLNNLGRYDEAEKLLLYALETEKRILPANDLHIAMIWNGLATLHSYRGDYATAVDDFRQMIDIYRSALGEEDYRVAVGLSSLASVYQKEKQFAQAEQSAARALEIYKKTLPADNVNLGYAEVRLGRALYGQRRYSEAEVHVLAGYEILRKKLDPAAEAIQNCRKDLVALYNSLHQPEKAREYESAATSVVAEAGKAQPVR